MDIGHSGAELRPYVLNQITKICAEMFSKTKNIPYAPTISLKDICN